MSQTCTNVTTKSPSLSEMLETKQKLEVMAKGKWMLLTPNGDVWLADTPDELLPVLMTKSDYMKVKLP